MTTDKTISSYFNPCSAAHDAMTNFKGLSCLNQMGIGAVVTLLAISILFAPFAIPVFRILNERCQVQRTLDSTGQKGQKVYKGLDDFGDSEPLGGTSQTTPAVTSPLPPAPISIPKPEENRYATYTLTKEIVRTFLEETGLDGERLLPLFHPDWDNTPLPGSASKFEFPFLEEIDFSGCVLIFGLDQVVRHFEKENFMSKHAESYTDDKALEHAMNLELNNDLSEARIKQHVNQLANALAQRAIRIWVP